MFRHEFLLIVQRHNFRLRIFILPSAQKPEALQTGYRGRWQKRFEVIAHFSREKGPDCLPSSSLSPVTASHATGERKEIKQLRERQRKWGREWERTVSLCSCSSGCFWITSVLWKERSEGWIEKGSEGEGSGAHSTNQGSYFGRGLGLALELCRTELSLLAGWSG